MLQIYHTYDDLVEFPYVTVCSFNKIECHRLDQEIFVEFTKQNNSDLFHRLCLVHYYSGCKNETNENIGCKGLETQNSPDQNPEMEGTADFIIILKLYLFICFTLRHGLSIISHFL